MIHLIYGGSGSGKSEFAEKCVMETGCSRKYYIATMKVYGDEGERKVQRHRALRKEKGFTTIEKQFLDSDSGESILDFTDSTDEVYLLECISNLTANEMFRENETVSCEKAVSKICGDLKKFFNAKKNIVIVSNNIFEDGIHYDPSFMEYMKCLAEVNSFIAEASDRITEVVCGLPLELK